MDHDAIDALLPVAGLICAGVIIFFLGVLAGRFHLARPFRHEVLEVAESETLGAMLTEDEKASRARAYTDPANVAGRMHEIAYAIPNVLTPFVGTGPKPGSIGNAPVNRMQFRSASEVVFPKPTGVYRIFLTGGSTAFGSCAPTQETTPGAYLEAMLNEQGAGGKRYEVFTFANPAWASTHERIAIENRLSELEPDMVISLSGNNDAHWAAAGRNIFWFRTYADQHCWNLLNLARRLGGLEPMPEVEEPPTTIPAALAAERLEKNLRLSAASLALKGAKYVFALQPMIATTTKPLSERETAICGALQEGGVDHFVRCYAAMKSRVAALPRTELLYLDLSDVFAALTAQDEIFVDSYHFGDRGNAILADALAQGIGDVIS